VFLGCVHGSFGEDSLTAILSFEPSEGPSGWAVVIMSCLGFRPDELLVK
jgi:hypothetical protein